MYSVSDLYQHLQYRSPLETTRFPSNLLWAKPLTADVTGAHTGRLYRSYFCKKERDFHFFVIPVTIIPESSFTHLVLNMQALPEGSRDCVSHKKKEKTISWEKLWMHDACWNESESNMASLGLWEMCISSGCSFTDLNTCVQPDWDGSF